MDHQAALDELLEFICGRGVFGHWGQGIHTYPLTAQRDANQRVLYEACLELERRGLVYRKFERDDHVYFMPTEAGLSHRP
jgi:hypothetical protein